MGIVKAAGVFLVRKDNKVLIGHPTGHKPDFWSIPKGKVEEGETNLEAALRETQEESNVNLLGKMLTLYPLERSTYRHKKKCLYSFIIFEKDNEIDFNEFDLKCNAQTEINGKMQPEMDDFKWATLDEAEKLLHYVQGEQINKIRELLTTSKNGK